MISTAFASARQRVELAAGDADALEELGALAVSTPEQSNGVPCVRLLPCPANVLQLRAGPFANAAWVGRSHRGF